MKKDDLCPRWLPTLLLSFALLSCAGERVEEELTSVEPAEATAPAYPTAFGSAPGSYEILSPDGFVELPFDVHRGDLRVVGTMNGREVRMLIDNGILWDEILFFGSPRVDELGMEYDGEVEVGGDGTENMVTSKTASGITIEFPGVRFTDQLGIITPYESGVANMWTGAEGQVCGTFFKHFVVDVDFDRMVITLTPPEHFEYQRDGAELPMRPLEVGGWAIPMTLGLHDGRRLPLEVMMDLGDWNPLCLQTDGANRIGLPEDAITSSLGSGIQGEIHGHHGRVPSVEVGGFELYDVLAGFVAGDYGGTIFSEAVVGLPVLARFNFTYDYRGGRMFIAPNDDFDEPF